MVYKTSLYDQRKDNLGILQEVKLIWFYLKKNFLNGFEYAHSSEPKYAFDRRRLKQLRRKKKVEFKVDPGLSKHCTDFIDKHKKKLQTTK